VWDNPIVVREMRARMRNNRALALQFGMLLALATTVFLALLIATKEDRSMTTGWLGQVVFGSLGVVQGLLLALISPAFAAGAFTLEREQQTIESLLLTPLRPGPLVRGKLLAATLFPLLLTTIALPLLSLCLLYGGVGPQEVGGTYVVQVMNALFLGALAVGWSMVCRSTATAVVATYLTVAAYLIGTFILGVMALDDDPFAVAALSPVMAPFVAAETVVIAGREMPVWIPSAGLLLFCTLWCLDACLARARELRLERGLGRPRLWGLLFCFAGGAAAAQASATVGYRDFGEAMAGVQFLVCLVGALGVLVYATEDRPPERPWAGWWRLDRPFASSAPLYLTLAPWAALLGFWLVNLGYASSGTTTWFEWNLALALATSVSISLFASAWFMVWLQQRFESRWATIFVGLALLLVVHILYAIALGGNPADSPLAMIALSPLPAMAALASDANLSLGWSGALSSAVCQAMLLLVLWLARATPTSPAIRESRGGTSRG